MIDINIEIDLSEIENLSKNVDQLCNHAITAGIHSDTDKALYKKKGANGKHLSVLDIAFFNYYGTHKTPPRKFTDAAIEKYRDKIEEMGMNCILKAINNDTVPYDVVGKAMANMISDVIIRKEVVPTRNSANTIRRKGFDHPLLETGLFLSYIVHKIHVGGIRV